jgi:cholesterol transport system auxiliary component
MSRDSENALSLSRRRLLGYAGLGTLILPISGCVTVLPKADPIQLYSFDFNPELVAPAAQDFAGDVTAILLSPIAFSAEAGGDRLISRENYELSYIGGARWSVPATDLFKQAVINGFSSQARKVRLETRGGVMAIYRLDITVSRFEVGYTKHKASVLIAGEARLIRLKDKATVATTALSRTLIIPKNKVSNIVEGYEKGASEIIAELVLFCESQF